jgi:hypothetical protein
VNQMTVNRLRSMRPRRLLATGLVGLAGAFALAGCTEVETESSTAYEPAHVKEIPGKKAAEEDLKLVSFTAEGARRVSVETAPVTRDGGRTVVPYESLIYTPDGRTYVYTSEKPLEYLRARVIVDRIVGDRVFVTEGPPAGTQVVTTGAPEVYGTELEIAGSH